MVPRHRGRMRLILPRVMTVIPVIQRLAGCRHVLITAVYLVTAQVVITVRVQQGNPLIILSLRFNVTVATTHHCGHRLILRTQVEITRVIIEGTWHVLLATPETHRLCPGDILAISRIVRVAMPMILNQAHTRKLKNQ